MIFLMTTIDTLKKFSQKTSKINKLHAALTAVFISLIFFQDEGESTFEFFRCVGNFLCHFSIVFRMILILVNSIFPVFLV